ncbi:hypothetical protein DL96DRAFT_1179825 [Flagelloscypha sp. PMI_526]|nr:hypothetical protein DL96DRAFT_1179825 [Flagelloscypha sp. PMI_526]
MSASQTASSLSAHHTFPSFEKKSETPVLYLPPLLSSLPVGFPTSEFSGSELYQPRLTETRLPDIDQASLSLHKALHSFRPLSSGYANQPYPDAFNWSELELTLEDEREWYCVVFRSKRKEGSDGSALYDADAKAHSEAIANGGIILYWYGVPDPTTGLNLASCIWQSRQHALAANSRPHHIRAAKLAGQSYERYDLERWVLRKNQGEPGLVLEEYGGGDVGW